MPGVWMRVSLVVFVLGLAAFLVARRLRPAPIAEVAAVAHVAPPQVATTEREAASVKAPDAFAKWIEREAERLDTPGAGGDQESAMAEVAAKLTPAQTRELLMTAKSADAPASEKILSTYLLVQAGPRALNELRELIVAPITEGGPAHSAAELNNARDKTLRLMALDGLSAHAATDPAARAALGRAVDEIADPFVKSQARERFKKISVE